jgi:hypothetical protein
MDKLTRLKVHEPATYRIYVQGELDKSWSDYFGDTIIHMEVDPDEFPVTTMTGQFHDQSALLGVISRLVDLGLPLLMLQYIPDQIPESIEKTRGVKNVRKAL